MKMREVVSSNIAAIGYEAGNPETDMGTLQVRFSSGSEYTYEDVPAQVAQELFEAESVGQAFFATIRNKYTTIKLEAEEYGEDGDLEEIEDE
jgi:hypothetical protein